MRTVEDVKAMATSLRSALAAEGIDIPHSRALEIVSRQLGARDWNTLSASLNGIAFARGIPILRIFDEEKARAFWVEYLGFAVEWEHRFEPGMPLYMQIRRSDLIIHLTGHHGDGTPGTATFIEMRDIRAFHAEIHAKNNLFNRPGLHDEPYGLTMSFSDPFGNQLRFCERNGQ